MTKRIRAFVNPGLLAWARETAGYSIDEAARKLDKSPETIRAWESENGQRPFLGQLRRLAKIYKRTLSDFYLPKPPEERPIPHDFRRSPGHVALTYSPALRYQLRLARERRDLALSLYGEMGEPIPALTERIAQDEDSEAIGRRLRRLLDIEFEEQTRWGEGRPAYNAWRRRIESLGILIFQFENVSPEEAWGFSIVQDRLPVIGINKKLAPNGRTFTTLHELGHVLLGLGEGALCDIDDFTSRDEPEMKVEGFCNRVAAATLMPERIFLAHDTLLSHDRRLMEWDDQEISSLARTFGVSREAAVRRLETYGLTSFDFYLHKRRQYLRELQEQRERERETPKAIKRNMPRKAIGNLGRRYVNLVLRSYHEDRITLMDASEYLGVRAERVKAVEDLATG